MGSVLTTRRDPMKTDLNSLVIFAQVVESNSFVKAARHLQIPTSTVSRRIAELEKQLGVRLIDRSTRRLRLTDVGSKFWNTHKGLRNSATWSRISLRTMPPKSPEI